MYIEPESWRPGFNLTGGTEFNEQEQEWLQRAFEEHEVLHSIKLCAIDKALEILGGKWDPHQLSSLAGCLGQSASQ